MGLQALARVMEKSGRPKQLIVCPKPQAAVQVNRLPRYPKAMIIYPRSRPGWAREPSISCFASVYTASRSIYSSCIPGSSYAKRPA